MFGFVCKDEVCSSSSFFLRFLSFSLFLVEFSMISEILASLDAWLGNFLGVRDSQKHFLATEEIAESSWSSSSTMSDFRSMLATLARVRAIWL